MTPTRYIIDTDRGYIAAPIAHPALDDTRDHATRYAAPVAAAAALRAYIAAGIVRSGIVMTSSGITI